MTALDTAGSSGDGAVRRVSWGAIFVGTVVALALMVFFTTLGLAIGAAAIDPLYDASPLSGLGVGSGIYIVVTQILSLAAGGFAAARLAGVPRTVSSLLHGAAVWALATLLLAWAAISGGGAIFGAASTMVANTARGAANVAEMATPDDFSFPDFSEIAAQVSPEDLPPELQRTLEENDITVPQLRRAAEEAFRNVVSAQEQQRALNILRSALADALRTPGDIGTDVDEAVDRLVTGPDAVFGEEDRQEVLTVLERRLGLSPEETEQVVQAVETRIDQAVTELRETLQQIQQQALETAQAATSAVATTSVWLTIASLLGLLAAVGGAFAGRPDGLLGDRVARHP
jgi:hypothetical protein